ncbi:4'-phosphopantetheinyl transferase superfamily protein [Kribbella sp. NBC_01505]|uniref:4'-phosphopantetheinyl transferase family protein n=1 Tax=Kribbella sp. NBC_01505 TaxID=2903580 RepID=UPI003870EB32
MSEVEVWWAGIGQAREEFLADLNVVEQERYARYRRDADKARFLLGVTLVRRLLGERMSVPPASVVLDRRCPDCGKPHGKVRAEGVELSVSHSGDWVGLAIGTAPVGLDVERIDSVQEVDGVAGMSLAPEELQELKRYDGIDKARAFTRYWTRKEALVKATGAGLGTALWTVVVSAPDQPPAVVSWDGGPAQLSDLEIDADHRAALAVLSAEPITVVVDQFRV